MRNILHSFLSRQLQRLGHFISKYPFVFIILPCIISVLLGSCLIMIKYDRDIQKLVRDENGRSTKSKKSIEELFPRNTSEYVDTIRLTEVPISPILYVVNKNRSVTNLLLEECLEELEILDKLVRSVKINHNGNLLSYDDLCGKVNGNCYEDSVISLLPDRKSLVRKKKRIKYPVDLDIITMNYKIYAHNLGGVVVDENSFVEEVAAFRIFYLMDSSNTSKIPALQAWSETVIEQIKLANFSRISVMAFSFSSLSGELKELIGSLIPLIAAVIVIVGVFSFLSSMTSSWVTSKPWLGTAAIVSAGLALISSLGLTVCFGIPFSDFHIGIPFLILGTEVDDAYILIATWRKTNPKDSVMKRMGDTFLEAGVSITITSLTNVLSCCIGLISPFVGVRYFCIYGAVALTFTYIYMITFFGACMALDGFREERLLNAVTFKKCSGHEEHCLDNRKAEESNEINTMKVFKEVLGKKLEETPVKIIIMFIFIGNIALGTWGLLQLNDGLDIANTVSSDSMLSESNEVFSRYFNKYFSSLHITIQVPLIYSDSQVQESIDDMISKFTAHPNIGDSNLIYSWLYYYKIFQNLTVAKFALSGYDLSVEDDFVHGLHNVFLRFKQAADFKYDIKYNENYTRILATRFILPIMNIKNKGDENKLLKDIWKIADQSHIPIDVYSNVFPLIEQAVLIRGIVFQITWITSILIFLIFLAFIPNFLTALTVSLSVIAALVESIGYASFWGIKLDMISMSSLVICVGFSINYPSHMAYAFTIANGKSLNGKMKESLYHVGLPVLQGSFSTLFSCCLIFYVNIYATTTFAKLVILVVVQTAFHAMFVIPVVLTMLDVFLRNHCKVKSCRKLKVKNSTNEK